MRKNKFVGFFIVISLLLSNNMPTVVNASDYNSNKMVTYLNSITGNSYARGYCLGFVDASFQNVYGFREYSCCAYKAGSLYLKSTSKNNIPIGACVFFSGSSTVCSTCKNNAGHVGIYVGDGNFVHVWSGQIKKTTIDYVISCGYSYRGWGWLCNVELSSTHTHNYTMQHYEADHPHREYKVCSCGATQYTGTYRTVSNCSLCASAPPHDVTITADKTMINTGDSVTFNFTLKNAAYWYCDIEKNGVREHLETVTGKYSYTYTFTNEGNYKVYLKAANSCGWTEPYVWITVTNEKPTISITADKTYVSPGDEIKFDFALRNTAYWYFVLRDEKGNNILVDVATGKFSYTYTFNDEGRYEVICSGANINGWTEPSIWINVSKDPEKPALTSMKASYLPDEDVVFDWNATGATTHYNLYIHKKNENGVYGAYEDIFYANSGISRTLEPGEYQVFVQSTNSNYYTEDGSTWRYTDSDIYEFKVMGHSVVYDLNGGEGEPEILSVCTGTSINITDIIPEKEGYKFLGWATSKDAATAEYHAGDSFTVNWDTTLYAVWQQRGIYVEASLAPSGKDYLCKVKIHDPDKGDLSYVPYEVYVPYYKDGRLVDVAWWDRVMWSDMYAILGDFDTVKVIVLESTDSMILIAEPVTLYK